MNSHISPASVLSDRVRALQRSLQEEANSLQSVNAFGRSFEPFTDFLRKELSKCLNEIDDLVADISGNQGPDSYINLVRIQHKATALFGEAFALRLAESIRRQVDIGLCEIADRLLQEFGKLVTLQLPQLATIAEAEFYGSSSRVIRLRYPAKTIWDLPVLAHEFAHLFGPLWITGSRQMDHPRESFFRNAVLGSPAVLDEYFCDLLATFILGPAYVCTCILDRFIPTIDRDSLTHPADIKRAWWTLEGLKLLSELVDDSEDRGDFMSIHEELEQFWKSSLKAVGSEELRPCEQQLLQRAIHDLFFQMKNDLVLAPYTKPQNAWRLVADFKEQRETNGSTVAVRDILNGAWFMRLQLYRHNGDFGPRIEERILDLARRRP